MNKFFFKTLFFLVIIFLCVYLIGGRLFFQSKVIQNFLKTTIEHELTLTLKNKIKINKIYGNVFSHFVIKDIQIFDKDKSIIRINKLIIYYNPIKLLFAKGDYLKIVTRISLINADALLIRNQRDQWNLLTYLDNLKDPKSKNNTLSLKAKIVVRNLKVKFIDQRGWGLTPLAIPFFENFINVSGYVTLRPKKTIVNLKGILGSNHSKVTTHIKYSFVNNSFVLDFKADQLPLNKWGGYVFPFPGYGLSGDIALVKGRLTSKPKYNSKIELPFYYNLNIAAMGAYFKTPFFQAPITKADADINLSDSGLDLKNFKGIVNGIEASGKGKLFFTGLIDLAIKTKSFEVANLDFIFPLLKQVKKEVKGTASSTLSIKGLLDNPEIDGNLEIEKATAFNLTLTKLFLDFKFLNHKLIYKFKTGFIENNRFFSEGEFSFDKTNDLNINFRLPNLVLDKLLGKQSSAVLGKLDFTGRYCKKGGAEDITCEVTKPNFSFYNQKINKAGIAFQIIGNDIVIKSSEFVLNNSKESLFVTGKIRNFKQLDIVFYGKNIQLNNIDPKLPVKSTGLANVSGTVKTLITDNFWKNPFNEITASVKANVKNYYFYYQYFENLDLDILTNKGRILVNKFEGRYSDQSFSISGALSNNKTEKLFIKSKNLEIGDSIIKRFLPPAFKNIQGTCDLDIEIQKQKLPANFPYKISGKITLKDTIIFDQYIKLIKCDFLLENNVINFRQFYIEQDYSSLNLYGKVFNFERFDLYIMNASKIDFSEFNTVLNKLGKIKGVGLVSGHLHGTFKNFAFDMNLDIDKPKYNLIALDHLNGKITYYKQKIFFNNFVMTKKEDVYQLSGYLGLDSFNNNKKNKDLELNFSIIKGSLPIFTTFIMDINNELVENGEKTLKKITLKSDFFELKKEEITTFNYFIKDENFTDKNEATVIYKIGNLNNSFSIITKIENEGKKSGSKPVDLPNNYFSGNIAGTINFKTNEKSKFNLNIDLVINNFIWGSYKAETVIFNVKDFPLYYEVNLGVSNIEFEGEKINSLNLLAELNRKNYNLIIKNTTIIADSYNNHDFLKGSIPLINFVEKNKSQDLDLHLNFIGHDINLLSFFIPAILDIKNEGSIQLAIKGPLNKPVINSEKIELKNAEVKFQNSFVIKSPLKIDDNDQIKINNNTISIPNLSFYWKGPDTKARNSNDEAVNRIDLKGTVSAHEFNLEKILIGVDLAVNDTKLTFNNPDFYNGDILLKNVRITGDYLIPISEAERNQALNNLGTSLEEGPTVFGNISFSNGTFFVPRFDIKPSLMPSIKFDLVCDLAEDLSLAGGFLGRDFLAGIANTFNFIIAKTTKPLLITGSLNAINIKNSISFVEGSVNFLDKIFNLMTVEDQRQFYKNDTFKITNNYLTFDQQLLSKSSKRSKLIPILNIKALTIIENNSTSNLNIKNIGLIINIDGSIYNLNSISFEEYNLGPVLVKPYNPILVKRIKLGSTLANTDPADLKELLNLLMPGVLVSSDQLTSEKIITNLGSRQIDLWTQNMLRPVERQLAKSIGIYDVRFDYNLGGQILNSLMGSTRDTRGNLGVNLVTRLLSDQLFLRVRTELDFSSESRQIVSSARLSEIALTYYLLPNLSLNYSNRRNTKTDDYQLLPHYSIDWAYEF